MAQTVKYTFVALDRFTAVSRRIGRQTDGLKRKLGGLNRATAAVGRGFLTLGTAAVGGLTAGLVGAVKAGSTYQDAMVDFQAITRTSDDAVGAFSDSAKELSDKWIVAASDVFGAMKLVASKNSDLLKTEGAVAAVTEAVLVLSNASDTTLPEAVDTLIGTMRQFGAPASEVNRYLNAMAAEASIGSAEIAPLGSALEKSAKAAAEAGVPLEGLLATISLLAANEQKAEIAGTALRGIFLKIANDAESKFRPAVVGWEQALRALATETTGEQRYKFFGQEGVISANIIADNVDAILDLMHTITGTNEAFDQAEKKMGTFNKRMAKIGTDVTLKLIDTFDRLEPKLTAIQEQFQKWLDTLTSADVQQFTDDMLAIVNAIASVIRGFGALQALRRDAPGGTSFFRDPLAAGAGALVSRFFGQVDVNVQTDKGAAATVTSKTKSSGGADFNMGVNMSNMHQAGF